MKFTLVVIRDIGAGIYSQPQCVASRGSAVRSFGDNVNSKEANNPYAMHPSDYELYLLGSYDDEVCEFTLLAKPERLAVGSDLVKK